jgi:hypothetical protein
VGEGAEAGHGDLFQEQIHPFPEVALAKEQRGRDRARVGGEPDHLDERLQVGLASAEATDDRGVHCLLAGEAGTAHQPMDGRVEEEDALQNVLQHEGQPVGSAGVLELVEDDRFLAGAVHGPEHRRKQDDRPAEAERRGCARLLGDE